MRSPAARLATAVAAVVVLGLLLGTAGAAPAAPPYSTGGAEVALPGDQPVFDLTQDANASLAAALSLDRIVEVSPGGNDSLYGPALVASAFPTDVRTYNVTSDSSGDFSVVLTANLTVYHTQGVLFPSGRISAPRTGAAIAPTALDVTVTTGANPGQVLITTQVTGWPWVDRSDLLALAWGLNVSGATGVAGCAATPGGNVPPAACGPNPLAGSPSEWGNPLAGFEGLGRNGPVAQLTWENVEGGVAAPTAVGTSGSASGATEVVLAEPAGSAATTTFAMGYAIVVPVISVPLTLHGSLVPYVAGLVGAVLITGVGLVVWRRRDERARAEL